MKKINIKILSIALLSIGLLYESHAQFVKAYARTGNQDQFGDCIVKIPGSSPGRYIVGGADHTLAMIMEVDQNGNKIWDYRFDVEASGYYDRIIELIIDSDGHLVGVGQSKKNGIKNLFVFRIDISSASSTTLPTTLWINKSFEGLSPTATSKMNGQNIHELPNDELLVTHGYNKRSCIVKLNLLNGSIISGTRVCYETNPTTSNYDDFNSTELHDGYLYVAGRSYVGSSASGRPAIWKIDLDPLNFGNVVHTEYYLKDKNTGINKGLYGRSMVIDNSNDDLSLMGYGNWDAINDMDDEEIFLIKQSMTDWDENAHWEIQFNPNSQEYVYQPRHLEVPGGYIIMATNKDASSFYLMRIEESPGLDINGSNTYPYYNYSMVWAKEYSGYTSNIAGSTADKNMIIQGQYVYIVRTSNDHLYNGENVLLAKCNIVTGEFGADPLSEVSCAIDIEPTIQPRDNFSDEFSSIKSYPIPTVLPVTPAYISPDLHEDFLCGPAPPCDFEAIAQAEILNNCTYQFTANTTGTAGGPFSYEWDFGDGHTSTEANPTHSYINAIPHIVNLTVYGYYDDGTNFTCCKEEALPIEVDVQGTCDPCPVDIGASADLINCGVYNFTATGNSHLTAVFWDFGNGNIGSGQSIVHHFLNLGPQSVTVTGMYFDGETCCVDDYTWEFFVEDCCEDEIVVNGRPGGPPQQTLNTGHDALQEQSLKEKAVKTYPNPVNGMLNITHPKDIHTIELMDLKGSLIATEQTKESNQSEISMDALDAGVYFLVLSGNERHVERIVKE